MDFGQGALVIKSCEAMTVFVKLLLQSN